jgi:GntR family transcriptional regulator
MAKTGDPARAVTAPATGTLDFALDRNSPVPLYHQLAQQLEAAIGHGVLAPGNLLGNEVDLSVRLGLSRPTVRQAIQSLVDKDPGTLVVRNERVPAAAGVATALGLAEGTEVAVLERLRLTHGRPVAMLCNYLPADLLELDDARLESTGLYRMMRASGITLHSARQTVGARIARPEEAERLGEPEGAALLTMQRTAYDDTGRPVEYGTHVYRASRYAFDFQLLVRS